MVGFTEYADAGLDLHWTETKFDVNIIISKHVCSRNIKFLKALVDLKDRVILHVTCTGYGGSEMEPYVPKPIEVKQGVLKLIEMGFPVEQMALRIDPVFANVENSKGIMCYVLNLFKDTGIKRVRYSYAQMYKHVQERFLIRHGKVPYTSFLPAICQMASVEKRILEWSGVYEFESCAMKDEHALGCVSEKDFVILGKTITTNNKYKQRPTCHCIDLKHELIGGKKQCPSRCTYCFWKDDESYDECHAFRDYYSFCSNFFPVQLEFAGRTFPSSENVYQLLKLENPMQYVDKFASCSPKESKKLGRRYPYKGNEGRNAAMWSALQLKFSDYAMEVMLRSTGDKELVEYNYWHDNYFGYCVCDKCSDIPKYNMLGKMLMRLRGEINAKRTQQSDTK